MLNFILKSCSHDKITPNIKSGYCPDCGEYVENHWYITRCQCCGIKQTSIIRNGKVVTLTKFCKNCGNNSYSTQELDTLDIVNINYAVVLKQTSRKQRTNIVQTWIEKNSYTPIKLLPSY